MDKRRFLRLCCRVRVWDQEMHKWGLEAWWLLGLADAHGMEGTLLGQLVIVCVREGDPGLRERGMMGCAAQLAPAGDGRRGHGTSTWHSRRFRSLWGTHQLE